MVTTAAPGEWFDTTSLSYEPKETHYCDTCGIRMNHRWVWNEYIPVGYGQHEVIVRSQCQRCRLENELRQV